jgi:putative hydrolase
MPTLKGPFFPARNLLGEEIPKIDAHIHTDLTDGWGKIEDYVLKAKELGLSAIAFTEHCDNASTWFETYIKNKKRLQALAFPTKVYLAVEVKISHTDGRINLTKGRIDQVDFVVGVLHRYPDGAGGYLSFNDLSHKEALGKDYQLSLSLISNPCIDVFGHPAGVYSKYYGEYENSMLRQLITLAVSAGKIIEINAKPPYHHVLPVILKRCLELNCLISIGSDAHQPDEVGHVINYLRENRFMA